METFKHVLDLQTNSVAVEKKEFRFVAPAGAEDFIIRGDKRKNNAVRVTILDILTVPVLLIYHTLPKDFKRFTNYIFIIQLYEGR